MTVRQATPGTAGLVTSAASRSWYDFQPAMRRLLVAVLALGLLTPLGLSAQRARRPVPKAPGAPAAPKTRTERAVPFAVGETLTYDVSWSSYVTAGTATAIVKEKKPSFN